MEEDSFEARVKRLFGSHLFGTVHDSSFPAASWCVADGEVERREWIRERDGPDRDDTPSSSSFFNGEDVCFSNRSERSRVREKDSEGDLDEEEGDDDERDEQEIRSSIGLDPTLDNEDEEDEYDRAALCRETAGERLYMRDIKDHGPNLSCHTVVPDLFDDSFDTVQEFDRDLRADHVAASGRLKEDKKEAESASLAFHTAKGPSIDSRDKPENDVNLKPILKTKGGQIDSRPKKRVRFDPGFIDREGGTTEDPQYFHMETSPASEVEASQVDSSLPEESSQVPAYLRNPSKYTHYTFDLVENDEAEANKYAFEDFHNLVKKSKPEEQSDVPLEPPRTVAFTPRKKAINHVPMSDGPESTSGSSFKESDQMLICSVGLSAGEALESGAFEMEEGDAETCMVETSITTRKYRQYRSKSTPDD